jgi:hypothetical protein
MSEHDLADPELSPVDGLLSRLDADMQRRLRDLPEARRGGYVCSELAVVQAALLDVLDRRLARGRVFCDWGSGMGAVCAVAASLGYAPHGIDIPGGLVYGALLVLAECVLRRASRKAPSSGPATRT